MKELTCIVCPNGCVLSVAGEGEGVTVSGNKCPKGVEFALAELSNPMRSLCSTVKTVFPQLPVLPVRLSAEIPKSRLFDVMREINKVLVERPIGCGELVIPNVLGLGVDVIASSGILMRELHETKAQ